MYDIPVVFHFKVEFDEIGSGDDVRFQEVNGLSAEINVEELREGGQNLFAHRLPNGAKYGNLVLKRGMLNDSDVAKWCRDAIENFEFAPKDATVYLLDEENDPLATWHFLRTYPVKWSIADLKAQENAIVVETLELAYQRFRKG